jgi:prephenate dehydrogenase
VIDFAARKPMKLHTLVIVGVGLIGGSIGLGARRRGLAERVIGVGRQKKSLEKALAVGAIDEVSLDINAAVSKAEVAVFCTPVDYIAKQILAAGPHCPPGTLLTDAGSTKGAIVAAVDCNLPSNLHFVGSHPLAGSEKRGPEFADADLFQDRLTVLTPTQRTPTSALERTQSFWQALGSRTKVMSPEEHDRALAQTSHLPHLAAAALAGLLPPSLNELTATGFRDVTRIAAGDPELWSAIFLQNRKALLEALGKMYDRLTQFKEGIKTSNRGLLDKLLAEAKRKRDALGS